MHHLHDQLHMPVDFRNRSFDELSDEEKWRHSHQKMHALHQGHEKMHAEMVLILIVTAVVAQFLLIQWKKRYYRSYAIATLIGMWGIPFCISLMNRWWRFLFIWLLFSCITCLIVRKAIVKPINRTTPRLVYKWFLFVYKLTYAVGIIGYMTMLFTVLGLNLVFNASANSWMDIGLLFAFYGLYFGVMGRDVAEICADKMASHIGYYTIDGMPTRHLEAEVCAVCGNKLLVSEDEEGIIENTYKLTCNHVFHEFCIRGWCIVGKKQTCPYCKEKVDLSKMFSHFWERPHVLYGKYLDWIHWLIAWQPLILFIVQGINWSLGLM